MKGFNKIVICILAAFLMTACGKEDNTGNNEEVAVRFFAQPDIQDGEVSAQTRASGDQWDQGDAIGVYAFLNTTDTPALDMDNKEYEAKQDGTKTEFIPADGLDIYFPVNGSDRFDFIAYYPYKESGTNPGEIDDYVYPVDVSVQTDQAAIDLLYVNTYHNKPAGYNKLDAEVDFIFEHKLSKFTLETIPGNGLNQADLDNMSVRIINMNTVAEFNLLTGDLSGQRDIQDITPKTVTEGKDFESIVLPDANSTANPWRVEFDVKGETYIWNLPADTKFEEGNEYIWEIIVQKTPILIAGTIIPFTPNAGNGTAW